MTHAPTHAIGQPQLDGAMPLDCDAVDVSRCTGLDCVGRFMMVSYAVLAYPYGSFPR
jgi:hypothetical protein